MAVRDFLDGVLVAIDSESLTDSEFETVADDVTEEYTKPAYEALKAILQEREGVSGQLKRLKAFFIAKGAALDGVPSRDASSQIFLGSPLD